jgi:hypothetical protein
VYRQNEEVAGIMKISEEPLDAAWEPNLLPNTNYGTISMSK